MKSNPNRVVVVGAGPAGMALSYLLARQGVETTLLEMNHDLGRSFRGEGLQHSGLDALTQMGFGEQLGALPQVEVGNFDIYRGGKFRSRINIHVLGMEPPRMFSQPALLKMMGDAARKLPTFKIEFGATVRDLIHMDGRVAGVRASIGGETRDFPADLVIGTDGRNSVARKHGDFPEMNVPQIYDILWVKVPTPDANYDRSAARFETGDKNIAFIIPTVDGQLQIGFIVRKGCIKELRAAGPEKMTDELIQDLSPDLKAYLKLHREEIGKAVLLNVICGRLKQWTMPGLLLLGDAAHPMSPVGGQGINLALRDALVAANHLCPVLAAGSGAEVIDATAAKIATERLPEIETIQALQARQAGNFFGTDRWSARMVLKVVPFLAQTGVLGFLLRNRMKRFSHGTLPVKLAV